MMCSLDAAELMPDASEGTMNRHFDRRKWYTPLPSLHVSITRGCHLNAHHGSSLA